MEYRQENSAEIDHDTHSTITSDTMFHWLSLRIPFHCVFVPTSNGLNHLLSRVLIPPLNCDPSPKFHFTADGYKSAKNVAINTTKNKHLSNNRIALHTFRGVFCQIFGTLRNDGDVFNMAETALLLLCRQSNGYSTSNQTPQIKPVKTEVKIEQELPDDFVDILLNYNDLDMEAVQSNESQSASTAIVFPNFLSAVLSTLSTDLQSNQIQSNYSTVTTRVDLVHKRYFNRSRKRALVQNLPSSHNLDGQFNCDVSNMDEHATLLNRMKSVIPTPNYISSFSTALTNPEFQIHSYGSNYEKTYAGDSRSLSLSNPFSVVSRNFCFYYC